MMPIPVKWNGLQRLLTGLLLASGAALVSPVMAAGSGEEVLEGEYSRGSRLCMTCHREGRDLPAHEIFLTPMGVSGDPASPFGEGNRDCEACHGPSKAHLKRAKDGTRPPPPVTFDSRNTVELQNSVCMNCHTGGERFHWPGGVHDVEGVACVDCHELHAANDPVLALETQPQVCYACHKQVRAQFLRQSRHPVQGTTASISHAGLMACTDCHKPHGSTAAGLLKRNTINEQCYECHAEKRGPFLWEHAPAREDCSVCHVPHGSNHENLLVGRQPWLCQQCHVAILHSSDVYSGTGIPPLGADQRMLGKQCLNCHVQVHGSNHPAGRGLTR